MKMGLNVFFCVHNYTAAWYNYSNYGNYSPKRKMLADIQTNIKSRR